MALNTKICDHSYALTTKLTPLQLVYTNLGNVLTLVLVDYFWKHLSGTTCVKRNPLILKALTTLQTAHFPLHVTLAK